MRLRVRALPTRPVTQVVSQITAQPIPQNPSIFSHISPASLEAFVSAIHAYDDEPVLRYSQRLSLIKLAAKLNIRRFDANLIIASIERTTRPMPAPQPAKSSDRSAWAIAMTIQAAMIGSVCWFLYI